ncbi:hypothetical protein P8605_11200 [Streptomyces sp. T-3]|nr:hypothetical protein [Streptomyces sp. T-3]
MKKLLEFVGVILLIQGVGGLVFALFGWVKWGLIQKLSIFDGYELFASIVVIVLAVAVFAVAGRAKP